MNGLAERVRIVKDRVNVVEANRAVYMPLERERYGNLAVLKFGGAAMENAHTISLSADAINNHFANGENIVVVPSAMKGVTDMLVGVVGAIKSGDREKVALQLQEVVAGHMDAASGLALSENRRGNLHEALHTIFYELYSEALSAKGITARREDKILSYGERLSERLLEARCLELGLPVVAFDSSDMIVTNSNFGNAIVIPRPTQEKTRATLGPLLHRRQIPIVTGFFAANEFGDITILGRNCSDYTAGLIANVMGAGNLFLYKDVDGVFAGDPKIKKNAEPIEELTFDNYHTVPGANKVIQPRAIEVLRGTDTVVWVKNLFNPHARGTRISQSSQAAR